MKTTVLNEQRPTSHLGFPMVLSKLRPKQDALHFSRFLEALKANPLPTL